jgi:hypothetical protein
MALYLKKLAVFDTVSEEVAELVNVMEGAEGSAVFGYNQAPAELQVADGQKLQHRINHTLDLSILPPTGADATKVDALLSEEPRPVKIAGCSGDTFLLWDEAAYLVQNPEYGDTLTRHFNMTLASTPGYRDGRQAVYAGANLLALYDVLSGDGTTLNGFSATGAITASTSGPFQSLTRGATPETGLESALMLFPFAGEFITLSMFVASANATYTFGFNFYDETGALVDTDTTTSSSTTSRVSWTTFMRDGAAFVTAFMRPGNTNGNTLVFEAPAIRLAGQATYSN